MPKIPVNPEELSGALGALRKAFSSASLHESSLPAITQHQLEAPQFIQEATAAKPPSIPDLPNPGRRTFLKGAAALGATAAMASPLARVAEHLTATPATAVSHAPVNVGSKLADWFTKVSKEHQGGLESDALGQLEEPDFIPTGLRAMTGIKTTKQLARTIGVSEQDLVKHLESAGATPDDPMSLIDELGLDHGDRALHHQHLLENGDPSDIYDSTAFSNVFPGGEHANDIQPGTSLEDATDSIYDSYLDNVSRAEMPLQSKLFGHDGFNTYVSDATLWPAVEEKLLDSGHADSIYDHVTDMALDHPNVDHEEEE